MLRISTDFSILPDITYVSVGDSPQWHIYVKESVIDYIWCTRTLTKIMCATSGWRSTSTSSRFPQWTNMIRMISGLTSTRITVTGI